MVNKKIEGKENNVQKLLKKATIAGKKISGRNRKHSKVVDLNPMT